MAVQLIGNPGSSVPHSAVRGLGLGPGEPGPPWGTQSQEEIHGCAAMNQVCGGGA